VAQPNPVRYSGAMGLIRSLFSLALLSAFLIVGFTVPLGHRTLFGHVANIWSADETQELVEGVKESSGPLVERVKRGVEAGLAEDASQDTLPAENAPKPDSQLDTTSDVESP